KAGGMPEEKTTPPGAGRPVPLWLLTLAAGLVAGSLSWLGGEATQTAFPVVLETPPEVAGMGHGYGESGMLRELLGQARRVAERNKTVAAYGLLGALLGVALGLIGGWSGGSARSGWRGAAVGGLTAGVAGAVLSWVLVPLLYRLQVADAAAQYSHPDAP